MLYIKVKKILLSTLVLFLVSSVLFAMSAYADEAAPLFSGLTSTGGEIFQGMRKIIYAVSGFGVVGIAIAGFFGSINWKWLSAIIIGLMVIALTAGVLSYMVGDDSAVTAAKITDTLINAN